MEMRPSPYHPASLFLQVIYMEINKYSALLLLLKLHTRKGLWGLLGSRHMMANRKSYCTQNIGCSFLGCAQWAHK